MNPLITFKVIILKVGSLVKEKGKEKHPTSTKKSLQDASHTEVAAVRRM